MLRLVGASSLYTVCLTPISSEHPGWRETVQGLVGPLRVAGTDVTAQGSLGLSCVRRSWLSGRHPPTSPSSTAAPQVCRRCACKSTGNVKAFVPVGGLVKLTLKAFVRILLLASGYRPASTDRM